MSGMYSLPRDAHQRLTRELAGEPILWASQPSPRLAFWQAALLWLFAVPWTAFSLAWEGTALAALFASEPGQKPDGVGAVLVWVFPVFGLPFVLIGLWMMVRPFLEARKARHTVHVLTEARLITAVLGDTLSIKSIDLRRVFDITRVEKPDGSGTMTFALGGYRDSDDHKYERSEVWLGIPNIRDLDLKFRQAAAAARRIGPDQPA